MSLEKYLLFSVITLSTLFSVYWWLIRTQSTFDLRRKVLLMILLLSVSLPLALTGFIQLPLSSIWKFEESIIVNYNVSESEVLDEEGVFIDKFFSKKRVLQDLPKEVKAKPAVPSSLFWNMQYLFLWIYGIGVLFFGIQLLIQFVHFGLIVFRSYTINQEGYHYVLLNKPNVAATFMHYILISKNIWESDDQSLIKKHECIHIQLRHSVDRILTEILFVFQWFNPFIYWFRKDLIAVHEYQVDKKMLGAGVDTILYQQLIVKYASLSKSLHLGNHFSQSLTLNRIKMIAQNKSFSSYQTYRILVFSFVALVLFCFFSFQSPTNNTSEQQTNLSKNVTTPPIPKTVDFAGEQLPMDNFDAKERFDRELISNSFRHSSTLLFLKKSNRYFPIIEPILKEYGIPDDFKYLAVGESALSNAVSPMGARGFWQFMPKTAEAYGLEVRKDVDERYHLEKSTIAACQYLKKAYDKFGSWTLAAAAYNMGESGLQQVIEKQGGETYFDLNLNEETSRYILRIMAIKTIMKNPSSYGFDLSKEDFYPPFPKFKVLSIKGSISDLTTYAKEQKISYRMLKIYNAWLVGNELTNSEGKEYKIRIPVN